MPDQQQAERFQAFWPNGPRPSSADAMADAVRKALDAAVALARGGDRQCARDLCAAVLLDAQPLLASRPELLRTALHALLTAHGFRLVSRLVLATTGRMVQVSLLPDCAGPIASPRAREQPGRTLYAVDPRWLDRSSRDDATFRQWCDALVARQRQPAQAADNALVSRHLEPA